MKIRWAPVPLYEGLYEVSNMGDVRSIKTKQILRPYKKARYLSVCLHGVGNRRTTRIHRIVCSAFHGPCPNGMMACHNNGNPRDNRASNLRWDTACNNHSDALAHGTRLLGESISWSKLTFKAVHLIRTVHRPDSYYASEYGVHYKVIREARIGKTWKHHPTPTDSIRRNSKSQRLAVSK